MDTDAFETQIWFGASHRVGTLTLESNVYLAGSFAEIDVGPNFAVGSVSLTPQVGIGFDFAGGAVEALIAPQLYTIVDRSPFYFESWIQVSVFSLFDDAAADSVYTRNFFLYALAGQLAAGPQVEATWEIDDSSGDRSISLVSLPIGGRVNLGYGKGNTLGVFLGYDTRAPDESDGLAGRVTFIREW